MSDALVVTGIITALSTLCVHGIFSIAKAASHNGSATQTPQPAYYRWRGTVWNTPEAARRTALAPSRMAQPTSSNTIRRLPAASFPPSIQLRYREPSCTPPGSASPPLPFAQTQAFSALPTAWDSPVRDARLMRASRRKNPADQQDYIAGGGADGILVFTKVMGTNTLVSSVFSRILSVFRNIRQTRFPRDFWSIPPAISPAVAKYDGCRCAVIVPDDGRADGDGIQHLQSPPQQAPDSIPEMPGRTKQHIHQMALRPVAVWSLTLLKGTFHPLPR